MTVDLRYLAYTAILTAALWIPYIIAQVKTNGFLSPENYVDPTPRPLPSWGKRADRTYLNAVEVFAPFAALVIIAHVSGKANAMTAFWAICFLLATAGACRGLSSGHTLRENSHIHVGLRVSRRDLRGVDEVAATRFHSRHA